MTKIKKIRHIPLSILTLLTIPLALAAVNINTTTAAELEALPGIGPVKAGATVAYRQRNGQFKTVEDLKGAKGIGEGIFSELRDEASVAPPTAKKAVPMVKQQ